jgi:hypothetical protein
MNRTGLWRRWRKWFRLNGRSGLALLLTLALAFLPLTASASGGDLTWPLDPAASSFLQAVESDFGFRGVVGGTTYHFGFDAGNTKGADVNAIAAGKVVWTGCANPIRAVVVDHTALGISSVYMHLSAISVSVGDDVNAGDKVGEVGPDNTNSYPYHLDFRIVKGGGIPAGWTEHKNAQGQVTGWSCPVGAASQYDTPARWFSSLDTGAPTHVEAMQVREGTSGGYKNADTLYKTDSNGQKYIEIDEDDIWVRLKVTHDDKDIDNLSAVLRLNDGGEVELHKFDYYAGTSGSNTTMPLRLGASAAGATDEGYVNTHGVSKGNPAQDIYYVQVKKGDVPTDGKIHKVAFRVKDAFDNELDIALTEVPVKRKGTYKVDVKPDQNEYTCCASPTFTVEVRDAQAQDNPLVDIDTDKEEITAKFMGKDATLSRTGVGTYRATTTERMNDAGAFPLTVEIKRKSDKKNLGTGAGSAKAKLPPQEYYTDRCGRRQKMVWNPKTCRWEIPPGNQPCQPDDNESVLSGGFTATAATPGQARIAVMEGGFAYTLATMLRAAGHAVDLVPQDFSPTIAQQYPALFVASGGFAGLGQSELMAERLARYTEAGGTLVVFTQPQGSQFRLLPGGQVQGYGYDEDLFCVYRSAYISSFGPQLSGQPEELLSLNIDGFFTRAPDGATVLLRRTLTGMPAMFTYDYGGGRVLATTTYADMAAQLGQATASEQVLLRDLATWALTPQAAPPRTTLGGTVNVETRLANPAPVPAAEAVFELIGPDGGSYGQWAEPVAVPAGGERSLTLPMTVPEGYEGGGQPDGGLWRISASLFDADGNHLTTIPAAGLYGVTHFEETPGGFRYPGQPYSITVTSETEEYLPGEPATFTFHLFNNSDTDRTFTVTWGLPHHNLGWDRTLQQTIAVPAHGQNSFTYQLPEVRDLDRLRARLLLDGREVAYVERGFWMVHPRTSFHLTPSRQSYAVNETPALTLTAMNQVSREYALEGTLVVTDRQGAEQAAIPVQVTLPARGTAQLDIPLSGPLPYGDYRVRLRLTAFGGFVGEPGAAFAVPVPRLQAGVTLPASLGQQVPFDLRVENTGVVAAPVTRATATLTDPAGQVVWSGSQDFALAAGATHSASFTADRGAQLSLGEYRLRWEVTAGGQVAASGEKLLPARLETDLRWEQPSYAIRETARATADVRNTGVWRIDDAMDMTLPAVGFQGQSAFGVSAGESASATFDIPLPDGLAAGSHPATLAVEVGRRVERSLPLTIPPSHVTVTHSLPAALQAGDTVELALTNTGGVDATASYTAALTDSRGVTVAEATGTQAVMAGGQRAVTLAIPAGAADGAYTLSVSGENQTAAEPVSFYRNLTVGGVAGQVSVDTDQDAYLRDQPVTVLGDVTVTKGRLDDGNLNLAIYALGTSLGQCEPVGTAFRFQPMATLPLSNAAKDAKVAEARKNATPPKGSGQAGNGLTAADDGWIGPGEPPANPWLNGYPRVYNEQLDVAADPTYGWFSMGTLLGDPATPLDDYARILYGHPWGGTSYTTLRVNGADALFGDGGQWEDVPHFDPAQQAVVATWVNGSVRVRQMLKLSPASGVMTPAQIQYQVENISADPQEVGLRIMLDTQLGSNDGAPFRVLGHGAITSETEFLGADVPGSFLVVDDLSAPNVVTQGVIRAPGERTPDRLVIADWGNLWSNPWDYTVRPTYPITRDSSVAYYWEPVTLAPGQVVDLATRYGATSVSFGSGELSTVLSAPDQICAPGENPFWVQAFVRNNTDGTAQNVTAGIDLPAELRLVDGHPQSHALGDLGPGAETQVSWLVRATGAGWFDYSVTTSADNAQGSTAQRQIQVANSVFDTSGERLVWQRDLPVTADAAWPFSELADTFLPGKYRAVATVAAPTGQVLAKEATLFYVAADQTLLTLTTDQAVYRVGDTVTISGLVQNQAAVAGTFNLVVTAGGQPVLTETVVLDPGQSHAYTATAPAGAEGALAITASARDASLSDAVTVAVPAVTYSIDAPAVVGRSPFLTAIALANTGLLPAHLEVTVDGDTRTFDLEPGARVTDTRTLSTAQDRQIPVAIRGDLTADEVIAVRQGEHVALTVTPEAGYVEGPVTVAYTVANTGELPATVPVAFSAAGAPATRTYTLAPGASLTDHVTFTLVEGAHRLIWQTGQQSGEATLQVRRPVLNRLALDATVPGRIPGTASLPVRLENTGENRLEGRVVVTLPWNAWSLPFDLAPGATADLAAAIDTAGAPGPGTYPVTVEAFTGEQPLARVEGDISLQESLLIQAAAPPEVGAGTTAIITAQVQNTGDLAADTQVVLDLPGIGRQQQAIRLAAGETASLPFAVAVPADLASTDLTGSLTAGGVRAPFTVSLRGFEASVTARLDRPYYQPGERAVLTLAATSAAPATANADIIARVNGDGYSAEQRFPAGTAPTLEFPLRAGQADQVLSYGLYLASGRSLALNTIRLRTATGNVALYTDRPVYRPGDVVGLTIVTREAGTLTVEGPGYQDHRPVNAGETTLQFTLPDDLVRGTYELIYALDGEPHSYPFEVNGPGIAVVDAQVHAAADSVGATLTVNASEPLAGVTVQWRVTGPASSDLLSSSLPLSVPAGPSGVVLPQTAFQPGAGGTHTLHYQFLHQGRTLAQGQERFDVAGNALLGIAPRQSAYREGQEIVVDVAAVGQGQARLYLQVNGAPAATGDMSLDGYTVTALNAGSLPAGVHDLEVRLDHPAAGGRSAATVTVLPLPEVDIRISGDQHADGFYLNAPAIRLVPTEAGATVYYRWNDGPTALYYGQPLAVPGEGAHVLHAYAEIDGARGPQASRPVALTSPTPNVVITEPQARAYEHDQRITPQVTAGGAPVQFYLDGAPIEAAPIDLFMLTLGAHTLRAEATVPGGNAGTAEVQFQVIATIRSTRADAQRMRQLGWIGSNGILNSLLAKLDAAQRALDRGQTQTAINQLHAFIHEVEAQAGKQITAEGAAHLVHDAEWIIAGLQ